MGREARIEYVPMPEALRGKYQYRTQADMRRLRAAGWSAPATPVDAAVRDYVVRHLEPDRRLGDEAPDAEARACTAWSQPCAPHRARPS
jgi:ADP-L-glycero-D-manno-heptose 6-epimerase